MRRRVKITGIGPVTPAGTGVADFRRGILEPISRARVFNPPDGKGRPFIAMDVAGFDPASHVDLQTARRAARHTLFAVTGAKLALAHAGLAPEAAAQAGALVAIGAAMMDFEQLTRMAEFVFKHGADGLLPPVIHTATLSAIGAEVCRHLGPGAQAMTWQSACCSGLDAVGHAYEAVATGHAPMAICGGTEAPLAMLPMLCFQSTGLASRNIEWAERQCRPFDLWRTTGAIGEGACLLVLEPEESPRPAIAWITGYAYSTDPAGDSVAGMEAALELALANARRRPGEIDALSAWGPGHRRVDAQEAEAMQRVFGRSLESIAAYSIKGAIGNPIGAAGAIQVGCAALDLSEGRVPPTVNWQRPDPACPLNLSAAPRDVVAKVHVVNAHGISANNAALVLERP